jgi:hypothetical protein
MADWQVEYMQLIATLALRVPGYLSDGWKMCLGLCSVARSLPGRFAEPVLAGAVAAITHISEESVRAQALQQLPDTLPRSVAGEAWMIAGDIRDEVLRAEAYAACYPALPAKWRRRLEPAMLRLMDRCNGGLRACMLVALARGTPAGTGIWERLEKELDSADDEFEWHQLRGALAARQRLGGRITDAEWRKRLEQALKQRIWPLRRDALTVIVNGAPAEIRRDALQPFIEAIGQCVDDEDAEQIGNRVFGAAGARLDEMDWTRIRTAAMALAETREREHAVAALAVHAPEHHLSWVLSVTAGFSASGRWRVLRNVSNRITQEDFRVLLRDATLEERGSRLEAVVHPLARLALARGSTRLAAAVNGVLGDETSEHDTSTDEHATAATWYPLWRAQLRRNAHDPRSAVLRFVRLTLPLATRIGGDAYVRSALDAVYRSHEWWPSATAIEFSPLGHRNGRNRERTAQPRSPEHRRESAPSWTPPPLYRVDR